MTQTPNKMALKVHVEDRLRRWVTIRFVEAASSCDSQLQVNYLILYIVRYKFAQLPQIIASFTHPFRRSNKVAVRLAQVGSFKSCEDISRLLAILLRGFVL